MNDQLINSFKKIEEERMTKLKKSIKEIKITEETLNKFKNFDFNSIYSLFLGEKEDAFNKTKDSETLIKGTKIDKSFEKTVGAERKDNFLLNINNLQINDSKSELGLEKINKIFNEEKEENISEKINKILTNELNEINEPLKINGPLQINDSSNFNKSIKENEPINTNDSFNLTEPALNNVTKFDQQIHFNSSSLNQSELIPNNLDIKEMVVNFLQTPLKELKTKKINDSLYKNNLNISLADEFVLFLKNEEKSIGKPEFIDKNQALEFKKYLTKRVSQMTSDKDHMDKVCNSIKLESFLHKEILADKLIELGIKDVTLRPKTSNIYAYLMCVLYDKELYSLFRNKLFTSQVNEITGAYSIYFNVLSIKNKIKEAIFFVKALVCMPGSVVNGELLVNFLNFCGKFLKSKTEFEEVIKFVKEEYVNEIREEPTKIRILLEVDRLMQ
ncbi:rio-like serine-threonine kinase [Tubulinosema ratisbonensis]|uniref:Rio-like serine-threonine kinase n=1 Tax=Tubulinosema ratisbonensis TaxID=291195 RepID=A0A437AN38_9MICR|nr:rio-like serine-threonine kinase [Tubulinosema ratisbonensis]